MAFRLPSFNLFCNLWHAPASILTMPPPGLPDIASLACQLRLIWGPFANNAAAGGFPRLLLLPALTDIRPPHTGAANGDVVEVPAGSGRFYTVISVEDSHKGFPNEYRVAVITTNPNRTGYWPIPTP